MTGSAHHRWWQIGEVVLGVPFAVAVVLQRVVPLSLPAGRYGYLIAGIGIALMVAGVAMIVAARRELARFRQPTDPGQPTSRLVTTGIFSVSRNPLYLAGLVVVAGLAILTGITWMLLFLVPTVIAVRYILIAPEERYLEASFGTEYRTYAASVARWLGRS